MSWLFSQVLVEEFSGDISWDGEPSALWNGTPTQHPSWCSDRTTAACRLSRSGMTFKPLMDDLGEAVLMLFLEAFPARTSAQPEKEQGSMASGAVCGSTWQELLVRFDRDSSSWKTAHCLWDEVLPESSVTLPRWGMTVGGRCWEREMPEHLTSETGSGLWRTPTAGDSHGASDPEKRMAAGQQVHLNDQVRFPTPTCADSWNPSTVKSAEREWTQGNLRGIAAAPVKMWPTPSARDWKDSPGMSKEGVNPDGSVRKRDDPLARRVFADPISHADSANMNMTRNRSASTDAQTVKGKGLKKLGSKDGGQLNPSWVEWLMGWPIGWTGLHALETDRCPTALPWPGES